MANQLKVVWFNGLNIDKIHFEQQERYLQRNIDAKTIKLSDYLYGIVDLRFSSEMLMQGKIALEKVSGITKDGSIFNAPEQDLLPEALDINYESTKSSIIVLKIPSGVSSIADIALKNNLHDSKYLALRSVIASRIYDDDQSNSFSVGLEDEMNLQNTTFTQEKINLTLASLRLKLGILGNATHDEFEIPIAQIKSIDSNGKIELEDNFIPTCININKFSVIKSFLEEMIEGV